AEHVLLVRYAQRCEQGGGRVGKAAFAIAGQDRRYRRLGWHQPVHHRSGCAVAAASALAKARTCRTASSPSAGALIRSARSSTVRVPLYPWSASQFSSPQWAGSRSTCESTFQPMVSTTSLGMVTPGT